MGAWKAPIPHLHITSSSSSSTQTPNLKALIPISRTPLSTRRLVLFSLPLATFLLPSKSTAIDAIDSSSSSSSSFNPSEAERDASAAISERISEALELLEKGRELQARGDFDQALLCFTQVIEKYKEFAFSDYARVGRALTLYEIGNRDGGCFHIFEGISRSACSSSCSIVCGQTCSTARRKPVRNCNPS